MGDLTLILGGAKSGKTSLALKKCEAFPPNRVYLATAQAFDDEMRVRIQQHQAERGDGWITIEESLDPGSAIRKPPEGVSIILMDCLTLWLSNLMAGQGLSADEAILRVTGLVEAVRLSQSPVVMVSNEVGLGIVPDNALARAFRDAAGKSHQILAEAATEVFFSVAGLPMKIK